MTAIYCYRHRRSDVDSCQRCEEENPIWHRTLFVHLNVNDIFLDPDGVGGDRSHAWEELRQDITLVIERHCNILHRPNSKEVRVADAEWGDNPTV